VQAQLQQVNTELATARDQVRDATEHRADSDAENNQIGLEARTLRQRVTIQDADLQEARSEAAEAKAGLRQARRELEEGKRSLEDLQSRTRLDQASVAQSGDQLHRLQQELAETREKLRVRTREVDTANERANEAAKAMDSFETRNAEIHQKDIEAFNLREQAKEMLQNASLEKEAGSTREAALHRQVRWCGLCDRSLAAGDMCCPSLPVCYVRGVASASAPTQRACDANRADSPRWPKWARKSE
jgi:phage shock protein A